MISEVTVDLSGVVYRIVHEDDGTTEAVNTATSQIEPLMPLLHRINKEKALGLRLEHVFGEAVMGALLKQGREEIAQERAQALMRELGDELFTDQDSGGDPAGPFFPIIEMDHSDCSLPTSDMIPDPPATEEERQTVRFKHVMVDGDLLNSRAQIPLVLGRTATGKPTILDLTRMPHLLIGGMIGSGKSTCINSFICSTLMTKRPDELQLLLVDPEGLELSFYNGVPHLIAPVVTECREATKTLQWTDLEMDRRYRVLGRAGAPNVQSYNGRVASGRVKRGSGDDNQDTPLPYIVVVVNDLAPLMTVVGEEVETCIQRVAQLGRAVGIHLIVVTRSPDADIVTDTIKASLTSRIAFRTIKADESRAILGHTGAEKLLGMGDMLFLRCGAPDVERYHGALTTEEDIEAIVRYWRE